MALRVWEYQAFLRTIYAEEANEQLRHFSATSWAFGGAEDEKNIRNMLRTLENRANHIFKEEFQQKHSAPEKKTYSAQEIQALLQS